MAFVQVVGLFDTYDDLARARSAIKEAGLADDASMHTEPDPPEAPRHPSQPNKGIWDRLKRLLKLEPDDQLEAYAEGVRRGGYLLVVTVSKEDIPEVKKIMRRSGAVELRRRIRRWRGTGWEGFDYSGLAFTEEE